MARARDRRRVDAFLDVMPDGPIALEDRPVFERAMALWREEPESGRAFLVIASAGLHADPWVLPLLDEIARDARHEDHRHTATAARDFVRDLLGLAPVATSHDGARPVAAAPDHEGEWMDQTDD